MLQVSKIILQEHNVRKTKEQKEAFRKFFINELEKLGYDVQIESGGFFHSRNIIAGDVEHAKIICTAHYDTCARMLVPNFITPMNMLIYLLYQILLVILIFATSCLIAFCLTLLLDNGDIFHLLLYPIVFLILGLMMFGPQNPSNSNDNTSGVITVFEILQELADDPKDVAFVFFDHEEIGLYGSALFAKNHKSIQKNTLLLNYDCVGDGDHMLMACNRMIQKDLDLVTLLEQYFPDTANKNMHLSKHSFYPSDQMNFKKGIGIAALKHHPLLGYYIDKIHTKKDVYLNESNIQYYKECSSAFIKAYRETLI